MKIFFVIDTLETGGAEKSILEIASRLPEDLVPYIITFYKTRNPITTNVQQSAKIRFVHFDMEEKYGFKKGRKLFSELCKTENPNIVVATLFRSEIITRVVCKKMNIPNIGTFVNDTYSPYELQSLSATMRLKIGFFKIVNSFTARYCTHFLSNAQSIKVSNAKALKVPANKISVIYRGRDISKFTYKEQKEKSNGVIRFLNVGRLLARKGQAELIQAFALFQKKYPEASLSIAGEGKYRVELERLISENNLQECVQLLGTSSDVNALFQHHDFFVFPSHYEGFSGAVVEAMLAGAPVIASDIEMNKEAISHLQTGYLFPVKNAVAMAEAMEYAVKNRGKMQTMAKNARQYAIDNFDINKIALAHADFYKKIISQ